MHGATLQLVRRPKRGDGAVTVLDSNAKRLKIPTWMLSAEAGDARIAEQACLSKHALQSLADLLAIRLSAEGACAAYYNYGRHLVALPFAMGKD